MGAAQVAAFLKAHPAFANMNHAQREAYRRSHPAFNNQWLSVNGFVGEWGQTAAPPQAGGGAAPAPAAAAPPAPPVVDPITAIPYDYSSDLDEANAYSNYNDILTRLGQSDNQINNQYTRNTEDVNRQVPALQRRLLNDFSGRGMARSSGYAFQKGEQENEVSRTLSDMLTAKNTGLATNQANRTNALSTRDQLLAAIARRRAAAAAGRAIA